MPAFCLAAREYLKELNVSEVLILGLRLRYRMSQREVANLLGVHEGTISRQTSHLRDRFIDRDFALPVPLGDEIEVAADDRERRAQIVRHHRHELAA